METLPVLDAASSQPATPTGRNLAELDSEDFFKMLITQLQMQDPLDPVSNSDVVAQISAIRDLESSTKLSSTLDKLAETQLQLASNQQFGAAAGLIGSYVEGLVTDQEGQARLVGGVVTGVRFETDGTPILELHTGRELPIDLLNQVTSVDELNRLGQKLIGKLVRGEKPDESGGLVEVRGTVESVRQDEIGLPILILDDGSELPLQFFREILEEEQE